jgi:uncharacterized protein (DUF488 family)
MDTRIKTNTIHVSEESWEDFQKLADKMDILYDATVSKLFKGYSEVELFSQNDYNKLTVKLNKYNIPYKSRVLEMKIKLKSLIKSIK